MIYSVHYNYPHGISQFMKYYECSLKSNAKQVSHEIFFRIFLSRFHKWYETNCVPRKFFLKTEITWIINVEKISWKPSLVRILYSKTSSPSWNTIEVRLEWITREQKEIGPSQNAANSTTGNRTINIWWRMIVGHRTKTMF